VSSDIYVAELFHNVKLTIIESIADTRGSQTSNFSFVDVLAPAYPGPPQLPQM
jgi:hypothetical protein